jgi:hypothetical protein
MEMKINLNDVVRVKLTDHGRAVLATDHAGFWSGRGFSYPYLQPKEDADGWSKWQLWSLMKAFGPHIGMGLDNCFDLTIQTIDKELPAQSSLDPMKSVRDICR